MERNYEARTVGTDENHEPPRSYDGAPLQSLQRVIAVITSFSSTTPRQTLSDVAKATGISRAAARRILLSLLALGYVRAYDRYFELGPRVLELGFSYLSSLNVPTLAQPIIEDLASELEETVSLVVLDDTDSVYVARARSHRPVRFSIDIGRRLPAVLTSSGRVLLSRLPNSEIVDIWDRTDLSLGTDRAVKSVTEFLEIIERVRIEGWASVDQELEIGICALAVPVDAGSHVQSAISISMSPDRFQTPTLTTEMLPRVRTAAEELGQLFQKVSAGHGRWL